MDIKEKATIKRFFLFSFFLIYLSGLSNDVPAQDYPIQPVPFTAVKLNDGFWAPRIKRNHEVTIPIAIEQCYKTGRVDNFLFAAGLKEGKFCTDYPFDDTDIYKIIEGASYSIQTFPDKELEAKIDTLIEYIGKAQEPDGYLYTTRTIDPNHPHEWAGSKRWEKVSNLSHELYNSGHLYEAAVAHYQATGKRTLLDIAIKNADLLCRDFGPGKLDNYPGHQIVEMGLVKMYRATGKKEYLDLAKFFLDIRDKGRQYNQSHKKVTEQTEAVGHAVRATYMYSGMADVAALTGDTAYTNAIISIWKDVIRGKLYITGGIGATGGHEGFGPPYVLPNLTAYNETCAAIGNIYWNYRLFLLDGNAEYYDVLERTLYNGMISGVSLSGDRFFYPNPLESQGKHQRSEWFGCACCPSNVCRFTPSVPGYIYAKNNDRLYVNLYMSNKADIDLDGNKTELTQVTDYPWTGDIEITLKPQEEKTFEIALRIPGWARNLPVPGDLYSFDGTDESEIQLSVNGIPADYQMQNGYAVLKQQWKNGDKINLDLPMTVRRIRANEKVTADVNRVALQRGPIVYCAEWPDNDGHVLNLVLPDDAELTSGYREDLLNGVTVIRGQAFDAIFGRDGKSVSKQQKEFLAIPYYAWANRGPGEMEVWLARDESAIQLPTPPGLIPNASFEKQTDNKPDGWEPQIYSGDAEFDCVRGGHSGQWCVTIASQSGTDAGWLASATVEPHSKYRLSAWIKTENISADSGRGALLNLHNIQPLQTPAVTGTKDWNRVEIVFNSGDNSIVEINCLLGGWGLSTGTAWYDDVQLELIP